MTRQERDPQRQNYEIRVRGHLGAKMLRVPRLRRPDVGAGHAADGLPPGPGRRVRRYGKARSIGAGAA
jgi:hypothetical protein